MSMALIKNTQYIILSVAVALFLISVSLTVLAGVAPGIAIIWNVLSSLYIYYDLIPANLAANSPFILMSSLLDAFVFALFTVFLATWFIDLLRSINIREYVAVSRARKMVGHAIVVPYNSFSKALVEELSNSGLKAVVIAESDSQAAHLRGRSILAVVGDTNDKAVFLTAGIARASYVIACDDEDVRNAMIAITAKDVNSKIKVISRVAREDNMQKLGRAGAYKIVLPGVTAGMSIGDEIVKRLT